MRTERNTERSGSFVAPAGILLLLLAAPVSAQERFSLEWTRAGPEGIEFYINTNLPDEAEISLSAYRTYTAMDAGKVKTYSVSYFEEKGPLSRFRLMTHIPTDDAKWRQNLQAKLDKWSRMGMPSEVDTISPQIEVTAHAYAHKTGPRFGARDYPDLMAQIKGRELAGKSEVTVMRPMTKTASIPRRSSIVAGGDLEIGQSYRLLGEGTPLMPSLRAEDWSKVRYMPKGTLITVTGAGGQRGRPFYRVALPEHGSIRGWINSVALRSAGARSVAGRTTSPARTAPSGLRAEVWAKVIDPCLVRIVRNRGGVQGLTEAQAVALAKTRGKNGWDNTADTLVKAVQGQSEEFKTMFYTLALTQCVTAATPKQ